MRPVLVFLPGNMCDVRLWQQCGDFAGFDRIDADLTSDDSIANMARRALGEANRPIIAIGFSMGGIVALEMARQAPDRVVGMVLADTNAGADLPDRAAARPQQQARVRRGELASIVADELKPAYLAPENRANQPLLTLLFDMAMGLGEAVFVRQSEALRRRADNGPVLDDFVGPILLMCGEDDALCPPAWHSAMAARCRRATLNIIAGAGHMLPLEQPVHFCRAVQAWLDDNKGEFDA